VRSASGVNLPESARLPREPHEIDDDAQQEHSTSQSKHAITRDACSGAAGETSFHIAIQDANICTRPSKNRLLIGAVALLCAAVIVFLVGKWRGKWDTPEVPVLAAAYQALEQGDLDQAARLFRRLGEKGGERENSQHYAGLAAIAFAREEHQRGLELVSEAERLDPHHAYSRVLVGQAAIALSRGDYRQAVHFVEKAKIADPEFAYGDVIYAHILFKQNKFVEATAVYQRVSSSPSIPPWLLTLVHNRLNQIAHAQGAYQKALSHDNKALK
jgi:tetratricopeptide (TPR) repeat protein